MGIFLDFGFAWVAVLFTALASIIYIFRKVIITFKHKNSIFNKVNRMLRKYHKHIGIIVVVSGGIHGCFSSDSVISVNLGTIAWAISILLGINWSLRKVFSKYKGWMYYHRLLTVAFGITIVLHVYDVGGIQVFNVFFNDNNITSSAVVDVQQNTDGITNDTTTNEVTPNNDIVTEENSEIIDLINKELMGGNYKDGTYTGEATGYREGLQVQVVMRYNTITSVEIINHNEINSRFYQKAFDTVPQKIIDNQSTDVDVTTGATFSSIGIMNAVNDALSQAIISGELPQEQALPANRGHNNR